MMRAGNGGSFGRPTVVVLLLLSLISVGAGASLFISTRAVALPSGDRPTQSTTTSEVAAQLSSNLSETMSPAELAAAFGAAVYRVETSGCGWEGTGTAFAISEHHLVTNWHVVANDVTPTLRSRDGTAITGRVIGWTENPDIAVVETVVRLDVALAWANASDLAEGIDLTSLGYPLPDHEFTVTPGTVLSFVKRGNRITGIRTDASVDRGSSGGPALTASGAVAGVVTEMDLNLDGFQFVPIVVTYEALRRNLDSILEKGDRPRVDCTHRMFDTDY